MEYGGLILAGPEEELLRRFYTVREQVWLLEGAADPFRGRRLRGLLEAAGLAPVVATSKYWSYGSAEAVESFGRDRAEDCGEGWYASSAWKHGLATTRDLEAMPEPGSSGPGRRTLSCRSPGVERSAGSLAERLRTSRL